MKAPLKHKKGRGEKRQICGGRGGGQSKGKKCRNMSNKMQIWVIKRERMCQRLAMYTNMQEQLIFKKNVR